MILRLWCVYLYYGGTKGYFRIKFYTKQGSPTWRLQVSSLQVPPQLFCPLVLTFGSYITNCSLLAVFNLLNSLYMLNIVHSEIN